MDNFFRFFALCLFFAHREAWRAAFGYASPVGGAILAGVGSLAFPHHVVGNRWLGVLEKGALGGLAGWSIVFLLYLLVVAPKKAFSTLNPVALKIKSKISVSDMEQKKTDKDVVFISLINSSSLTSIYCRVFVVELSVIELSEGMEKRRKRLIHSCNIPRENECKVQLADLRYWRSGSGDCNYEITFNSERGIKDDLSIVHLNPKNNRLEFKILIESQGLSDITQWCRVFVDNAEERLVLKVSKRQIAQ